MGDKKGIRLFGGDKLKTLNVMIWTSAVILIILTLLTAAVVVMRIGNLLPNEFDFVFLVPKEPEFVAGDGKNAWSDSKSMGIFQGEYTTSKGEVVAVSGNGDSIFAPGSTVTREFEFRNSGNMAIDYDLTIDFGFLKNNVSYEDVDSPLVVRLYKKENSAFIIGTADEWLPVGELGVYKDEGTLGVNCYSAYVLELKWEYDRGMDDEDTILGNMAIGDSIQFDLNLGAYAELNPDPDAKGGILDTSTKMRKVGGSVNTTPFVLLAVFMVASAVFLILAILTKKKTAVPAEQADADAEVQADGETDAEAETEADTDAEAENENENE